MTKTERTIYAILGPTRYNIFPLASAVDRMMELLFARSMAMEDILVSKDVYLPVARDIHKTPATVSRQIERLANLCWSAMQDAGETENYIGKNLRDIHAPSDILYYLAYYVYYDRPFFTVIHRGPTGGRYVWLNTSHFCADPS